MAIITPTIRKPEPLVVDGEVYRHKQTGKLLGCRLTNRGYTVQIKHNTSKARVQLGKLHRFRTLDSKIKRHLYTALVRPILEYPPIPLHTAKISNIRKLQTVQSIAVRWINGKEYPQRRSTNEELHRKHKLEAINVRLHNLARRIWERATEDDDTNIQRIAAREELLTPDQEHTWWPRSKVRAMADPPEPLYV